MATITKSKNYWYVCETRNKKKVYLTKGYSKKSEALAAKEKIEAEEYVPDSKMSVKNLLEEYYKAKCSIWSISEMDNKRNQFKYILDDVNFSNIRLNRLTSQRIQMFFDKLNERKSRLGKPYAPKTIRNIHQALTGALNFAVDMDYLQVNPCKTKLPRPVPQSLERKKETDWSDAFIADLLNKKNKTQMELIIAIGILLGLRIGEIIGLREEDIDFKKKTISINWTLRRINNESLKKAKDGEVLIAFPEKTKDSDSTVVLKVAKTGDSIRTISVDELLLADIKRHIETRKKSNYTLLFQNENGEFLDPKTVSDDYAAFQKDNNLPKISFHRLRKYNTYFRLKASKDVKSSQVDLGHKDSSITLKYYALIDEEERKKAASESFEYMRNLNSDESDGETKDVAEINEMVKQLKNLDENEKKRIAIELLS